MSQTELDRLISEIDGKLVSIVKEDVLNHLAALSQQGVGFYGYAIQTPTWTDIQQPIVVYNCEDDLDEDQKDSVYDRYSVDEWQHYEGQALPLTTQFLEPIEKSFDAIREQLDDVDPFYRTVYLAFAKALHELQAEQRFQPNVFLIVWNEDEELMVSIVQQLNSEEITEAFEEEFGF